MEKRTSLNTKQAAKYLSEQEGVPVRPGTLEVWRAYGRGPRYRKVARWVIYEVEDLQRFARGRIVETVDSAEAVAPC